MYADSDGDGKGDPENKILSCGTDVEGYVTNGGDCDDSNADVTSEVGCMQTVTAMERRSRK